ncbi:hypothetical protein [Sorangium sp. So ce1078]|uniref:hypothetical protein n=1 Tax=Sorangium sp. So ce1078 TaxID=3133329 RepID=UPI003F62BB15
MLNFYSDLIVEPLARSTVALSDEYRERKMVRILAHGIKGTRFSVVYRSAGWIGELLLPRLDSEVARRLGLDRASVFLADENPTQVASRVLAAFRWAGQAAIEGDPERALLLYIIALESILTSPDAKGGVASRMRHRVRYLLADTIEDRRYLWRLVGELYEKRSNIVHKGKSDVTEADLRQVRDVTKSAAVELLTGDRFVRMRTNAELERWFDDQMLMGGLRPKI